MPFVVEKQLMPHAEYVALHWLSELYPKQHFLTKIPGRSTTTSTNSSVKDMHPYPEYIHCYCYDHKHEKLRSFRESLTASTNAFMSISCHFPKPNRHPLRHDGMWNTGMCHQRTPTLFRTQRYKKNTNYANFLCKIFQKSVIFMYFPFFWTDRNAKIATLAT